MGKCDTNTLMAKIGYNKIDNSTELSFAVLTDIENCNKINTKNYIGTTADSVTFNSLKKPVDVFNCMAEGCVNSGTLLLSGAAGTGVGAKFLLKSDATDFMGGLSVFYVYLPTAGAYEVAYTISDESDAPQANADVYTQTVVATEEGFKAVIVDFSQIPQSQDGTGWEASIKGAIVNIIVTPSEATVIPNIGISSIVFHNFASDLEVNDLVKVGCIDDISGDLTVTALEATCWASGYDPASVAPEKTITARSITPNGWKLNPLMGMGEATEGWDDATQEVTVQSKTVNGITYGYVQFMDMFMGECAFTGVALADNCNVTDASMNRISSPVPIVINERQFIVLDGTTTTGDDVGVILVHESLIGERLIVSYPKQASVIEYVANADNLGTRRVRMSYTKVQTDGIKIRRNYNNVLVTSYPDTLTREETTFPLTLSIQKDRNGNYYTEQRITD